ncbi:hypothetical protein C1877_06710 [Gordonibacter pamelaeae]|uniref:Uncharacterized protein n=1 Tax=Gordonibacter pamelaeae TaxID=471189 RepID=A0A369M2Z7_9ACTN|nr:hypothetical protein C1877_06710 [Gordonibacter pamelaeae]
MAATSKSTTRPLSFVRRMTKYSKNVQQAIDSGQLARDQHARDAAERLEQAAGEPDMLQVVRGRHAGDGLLGRGQPATEQGAVHPRKKKREADGLAPMGR